jgi:hypothetical protein
LLPVFGGVCVLVGVCVGVSVLLGVCVGVTAAGVGVGDGVGVGVAHPNEITTPLNMSVLVYPEPIKVESTKTLNGNVITTRCIIYD